MHPFPASAFPIRLPRYHRLEDYPDIGIGRPEDRILAAIAKYSYLSADQVARLLFSPKSLTYVRERLARLFHARYVSRVFLPVLPGQGSSRAIYHLDYRGRRYLAKSGRGQEGRFRPDEMARRELPFLEHTLQSNEILILAERLVRLRPGTSIARIMTDYDLHRAPVKLVSNGGTKEHAVIVPDGFVDLDTGDGLEHCIAWECDRATGERKAIQRKIRGYVKSLRGHIQKALGVQSLTVAFVAAVGGEKRLGDLINWTSCVLKEERADWARGVFLFSSFDPASVDPIAVFLSPVWHQVEGYHAALLQT